MKTELLYLTYVTAFTGLLWVPYILNRIFVRGVMETMGYDENPEPHAPWAQRLMKAHLNAVENLVVFGILILIANSQNISNDCIAITAIVFFWTRIVHALSYTFAIPGVRTVAFVIGFVAQATVACQIIIHS
jgi:uncharacterized MAPEG superfamily protein